MLILTWGLLIGFVAATLNMAVKFVRTRRRTFLFAALFWLTMSVCYGFAWR